MFNTSLPFGRRCAVIAITAALLAGGASAQSAPSAAFMIPNTVNAGDAGFTLSITGGGFVTGSVAYWGTQLLPSTVVSPNQINAVVGASLLSASGQFPVFVINPNGGRSNNLTFTVLAVPVSITTAVLPPAQAGVPYSQTLAVTGGTAPYVWNATGTLPSGLALSQAGVLSGTPATQGTFSIAVRVTDAAQRSATRALTLSITAPAIAIRTPSALPNATEGAAYTQALEAENATPPLRWTAGAGLPPGITLDAAGVLRGTPSARGNYSFTVQVADSANASAGRAFTLTVQAPPLAITTVSPLFSGTAGSGYAQTFTASGGQPPYAWTMRGQVPGLTLDRATGVLSGTAEQAGTYPISIQVTDGAGATVSRDFSLLVEAPQLRITNNSPLPSGVAGTAYQQRFLSTGGQAPYTWSVAAGALPPGLALNSATGVLSGTPAASGTFNFTVALRDNSGATASRPFSMRVEPGPLQLSNVAETLRNTAGDPFSTSFEATGGTPPYTWSANGLVEGIDIDAATGQLSGMFRTVGSFLFTVRVTDAARATATELVRVEVSAPPLPALSAPGVPEVAGAAGQVAIRLQTSAAYRLPLAGQLTLSFAPETGSGDPAVQFSTGGRTVDFRIPVGATQAEFPAGTVGLQTGTVAGSITLLARLQSDGVSLTPTPVQVQVIRVERTAPAITNATFARSGSNIEVRITGYSTTREITQGVFRFRAGPGNTLSTGEVTLPLEETFSRWFRDSGSTQYGGQFTFTQQFSIQGDVNAVTPVSVTLSNRTGSTSADIRQ